MSKRLIDDCFRPGIDRMPHAEAIRLLRDRVTPVAGVEDVSLAEAAGRILAEQAIARSPVPGHTNAAVDGYAFSLADPAAMATAPEGTLKLRIEGRAAAGRPMQTPVHMGAAARVLTGAIMPAGADTVVMQEDVELAEEAGTRIVTIPAGLKRGANVRKAGEDLAPGTVLMDAGTVIRPQDLAGLASIGLARVTCFRRLRVGIISSGDEVLEPGSRELRPGEVFDANTPMLKALAEAAGAEVTTLGIWPDRGDEVRARLLDAAGRFDVLLTSGGASLGEEDHMAAALDALGERHLWQIAIKPGRPLMFGTLGDAIMVGLPGNPVAVFVCFLMYVHPLLRRLGGGAWREPRRFPLPAAFEIAKRKTGRREFWRGILVGNGPDLRVDKFMRDGSGLISGLRQADGLIDVGEDVPAVKPGDMVDFIPFSEFAIPPQ